MTKLFLPILLLLGLTGCGARALYIHSQEVADDLKPSVGIRPNVTCNWTNGSLVYVSVNFDGIPTGKTNEEIAALARKAVAERFERQPERLVISYTLLPDNNR